MAVRSIRSLARSAAEETRTRIHLHLFYSTARVQNVVEAVTNITELSYKNVFFYENQFGCVTDYIVSDFKRLKDKSNYMRFYVPQILQSKFRAEKFIYLDSDTGVLNDVAGLYDRSLAGTDFVMAGAPQAKSHCWFGKLINTTLIQDVPYGYRNDSVCISPCVTVVDIDRWIDRNLTWQVEYWLKRNYKSEETARLWKLGSMPPIMMVLGREWEKLDSMEVFDMKTVHSCCPRPLNDKWEKAVILHPIKNLGDAGDYEHLFLKKGDKCKWTPHVATSCSNFVYPEGEKLESESQCRDYVRKEEACNQYLYRWNPKAGNKKPGPGRCFCIAPDDLCTYVHLAGDTMQWLCGASELPWEYMRIKNKTVNWKN